jgi:hypothetical protein
MATQARERHKKTKRFILLTIVVFLQQTSGPDQPISSKRRMFCSKAPGASFSGVLGRPGIFGRSSVMRTQKKNRSRLATFVIGAIVATLANAPVGAVGLRSVIRDCGGDGESYCQGVGYGAPMQACLARHYKKLTPACRTIMDRLNKGETVEIFG